MSVSKDVHDCTLLVPGFKLTSTRAHNKKHCSNILKAQRSKNVQYYNYFK